MVLKRYMQQIGKLFKEVKNEVLIGKYTQLVTRLVECMEDENWSFFEAAEYLMCSEKEFFDCIGILRIKKRTVEDAVRQYILNNKEEPD